MFVQIRRDFGGVGLVLAHAERERLEATEGQEGVERREHVAHADLLEEPDFVGEVGVVGDDGTADGVAVAVQVLRRAVDDDVGTEFERVLEVRREEGVVHAEGRIDRFGDGGDGFDVTESEERVRRRLHPDECRFVAHGVGDGVGVAGVHEIDGHAETVAEQVLEHRLRPAVEVVERDDVVAGADGRRNRGDDCGRTRGEGHAVFAAFERRDALFQRVAGRVRETGVEILVLVGVQILQPDVRVDAASLVGRCEVDGHRHVACSLVVRRLFRVRHRHRFEFRGVTGLVGHTTVPFENQT